MLSLALKNYESLHNTETKRSRVIDRQVIDWQVIDRQVIDRQVIDRQVVDRQVIDRQGWQRVRQPRAATQPTCAAG